MSVWLYHLPLSVAHEEQITSQNELPLPFDNIPELTGLSMHKDCCAMLKLLHPELPPETVNREADRLWNIYTGMQAEDVVVVPLLVSQKVALARIESGYHYKVGSEGEDRHLIGVSWPMVIPLRNFGKHKALFTGGSGLREITNREEKQAILDKLPTHANRFAKLKWLAGALIALRVASYLLTEMGGHP